MRSFFVLLLVATLLVSCQKENRPEGVTIIDEVYQTNRNEDDNVDSPSFYQNDSVNWIISTAKATDVLIVNDAVDGKEVKRIGGPGTDTGKLKRPNGVWVIDNLCLVVERDNHRVQVFGLPEFNTMGFIGEEDLVKPYGLTVFKKNGYYHLYVTDNYEIDTEEVPADSLLGNRVHYYKFMTYNNKIESKLAKTFGATSGDGVLKVVESIYADTLHNHLLISEELEPGSHVKVYDLDGNFKNKLIGTDVFKYQAEGIALLKGKNGSGYWVLTDQTYNNNTFHVFDRVTFKHVGAFAGPKTTNTDGIWLTQKTFKGFSNGAFFAVHNDGNVSAFNLETIISKLNLKL